MDESFLQVRGYFKRTVLDKSTFAHEGRETPYPAWLRCIQFFKLMGSLTKLDSAIVS